MESMKVVENFLDFTAEIGDDFQDGWLPTLDVSLKVDHQTNQVLFRFYEKETTNKRTVQRQTAMNENCKIQVVSNDLVRRLQNTCETLGAEEYTKVVDQYARKLLTSGYSLEQCRRIIVAGIKNF